MWINEYYVHSFAIECVCVYMSGIGYSSLTDTAGLLYFGPTESMFTCIIRLHVYFWTPVVGLFRPELSESST